MNFVISRKKNTSVQKSLNYENLEMKKILVNVKKLSNYENLEINVVISRKKY